MVAKRKICHYKALIGLGNKPEFIQLRWTWTFSLLMNTFPFSCCPWLHLHLLLPQRLAMVVALYLMVVFLLLSHVYKPFALLLLLTCWTDFSLPYLPPPIQITWSLEIDLRRCLNRRYFLGLEALVCQYWKVWRSCMLWHTCRPSKTKKQTFKKLFDESHLLQLVLERVRT